MGIHLPVQPVERVERDDAAPAVEQRDAGPARTPTAPPGWRQVRRVLREHQLRVPLLAVGTGVVDARQPAQIGVERGDFVLFANRLQPGVEHHVRKL